MLRVKNKSALRILYLVTGGHIGGPQTHLTDCVRNFSQEFNLVVAAGGAGKMAQEIRDQGVPFHTLSILSRNRPAVRDPWRFVQLMQLVREFRPHLVSCHSTKAGLVGRIAARFAGIPALFTAHGWAFSDGVPFFRKAIAGRVERLMASWSGKIICVSEHDRHIALVRGVGNAQKMILIHNGVSGLNGKFQASPSRGPVILIMVARFAAPKNQTLLLQALAFLPSKLQWEMWFVGSGPREEMAQKECASLQLSGRVRFLGERKEDIPELLSRSSIFALISNWEGFPRSILEAMRAGLPVLASDVGGISEAVIDGATGFLCPHGDRQALSNTLEILISNPLLRAKMGEAGRRRFLEHFTLEKMLTKTRSLYYDMSGSTFC